MRIYETLARIWLPEQAVQIYLSLLEYGQGNVSDIARSVELHRAIIYRYLPLLEECRLISKFVSGKRTLYRANDPKHLRDMLSSLESRLDIVIETLQEKQKKESEWIFEYGRWVGSLRYVHKNDILESPTDSTLRIYSSQKRNFSEPITETTTKELRHTKRISRKIITNMTQSSLESELHDPLKDVVCVPENQKTLFDYDIAKSIRDDTVTIVDYETLETFVIKNRQLAQFESKVFDLLFDKLKR
jgi:sugar-specific transcriptional regulator TrmB